ncbi:hypothetical protein D3C81_2061710 [compost metagenome]
MACKVGGVVPSRVQAKRWRRQLGSVRLMGCPRGQQIAATPTFKGTGCTGALMPR